MREPVERVVADRVFLDEHRGELSARRRKYKGHTSCQNCGLALQPWDTIIAIGKMVDTGEAMFRVGTIKTGRRFQTFAIMCLECGELWESNCDRGDL